jgi:hypothetical protein
MKNCNTGTGLIALSIAILGSTLIMRFGPGDSSATAASTNTLAQALAAAATAQATPTIVWYGNGSSIYRDNNSDNWIITNIARAWSDGRVESRWIRKRIQAYPTNDTFCNSQIECNTGWIVVADSNQGLNAAADINFDSKVDGEDLSQVLAAWGNAPRHDIPPSDCPLNLVNP